MRLVRGGQQQARHEQLEVQAGTGGPHHVRQCEVGDVCEAGELRAGELRGLRRQTPHLVLRHAVQDRPGLLRQGTGDHEVSEAVQQVLHEPARVLAGLHHTVHHAEHGGGVVRGDGVDHVVQQGFRGEAEQAHRELVRDLALLGARDQLVQHGERVTHRARAGAHHERQHALLHGHGLLRAQLLEVGDERLRRHEPERVVVGAGADGPDDLLRLRGGEDELQMLRRLLHDLEQRVEARRGDHVRLVDDEDLVAVPDRGERGPFAQAAGVLHTAVRGRVDLQHVQRARPAGGQVPARVALAARRGRGALGAVQAAREDAGGRGLAAAARAGEEVGVVHAVLRQCGAQRDRDMVLPDHVLETVRAVAAIQGGAHPRKPIRRADGLREPGNAHARRPVPWPMTTTHMHTDAEDTIHPTQPAPDSGPLSQAEIDRLFADRHTTQLFSDEPVDLALIERAYADLRWAPTAMNNQPLRLDVVDSPEARARLAPLMIEFNREKTERAPLTLIASYDLDWHRNMGHLAPFREGFEEDAEGKPGMREGMGRTNALIQVGYLLVALRAHGLEVGPMAGFDAAAVDAEFHADRAWKSLLVINVGHAAADDEKAQQPREGRLDFDQAAQVL
ncbi:Putative NADH dehydrogenase/NAD(P)H nitroreductase SCO5049 [Micrococcus luteus Mu201]|nr:Putative NADH dehydrogenase/NAD(P)H nitroreductase SCO5049 [Micrococcus luteus Mu201]